MRQSLNKTSNSQTTTNKKLNKNKKQIQTELQALFVSKSKSFRVFYPILEEDDCDASELNECHQIVFPKDMLLHHQSSFNFSNSNSEKEDSHQSPLYRSEIFKWFDSLSICQRVNALTCTSPYLAEILQQMHRTDFKKGCSCFFVQTKKQNNYQQSYLYDPTLSKNYKDFSSELEMQFSKYNQPYYMGNTSIHNKYLKFTDPSYANPEYENLQPQTDQIRNYPQFFEEVFVTRVRHFTEIQQQKINEPFKFFAQQIIEKHLRFCDMFQYCDTITVDFNFVSNSKKLFDVLSNCTEGQAFQTKCQLVFDQNLGIHVIQNPSWFHFDRFNTFYAWVASILEENLWANFQLYEQQQGNADKNQPSIDYLFDYKLLQVQNETQQLANIRNLTEAWMNATSEKKKEVTEQLLSRKSFEKQLERESPKSFKDLYSRKDFFYSDGHFQIDNTTIQYVVEKSLKIINKQKYHVTHEFITELLMSTPRHVETFRDIVHRHMLFLIKDMRQDQLIEELLEQPQSKMKKRKNKKKDKQQIPVINKQDIGLINNKSDQKMADIKSKKVDQKEKKQNQTPIKIENSHDSLMQSDVSIHTCVEHVIEGSDTETLIFKDPIIPDDSSSPNEFVKLDMSTISSNYVSSMLQKIEKELAKEKKDEYSIVASKKQKKKKAKKPKEDQQAKVPQIVIESEAEKEKQSKTNENQQTKMIQSQTSNKNNEKVNQKGSASNSKVEEQKVGKYSQDQEFQTVNKSNSQMQPQKQNKKKKNQQPIVISPEDQKKEAKIQNQNENKKDLVIKKNQTLDVPKTKVAEIKDPKYEKVSTQSKPQSRQESPFSSANPENSNNGARKRNRKKNKTNLDPQEAMNQFILQLNSKKDEFKKQKGRGPQSKNTSRRNSNTELKFDQKQPKRTSVLYEPIQQPVQKKKQKNVVSNSMMQQDLQQLLNSQQSEINPSQPKVEKNEQLQESKIKQKTTSYKLVSPKPQGSKQEKSKYLDSDKKQEKTKHITNKIVTLKDQLNLKPPTETDLDIKKMSTFDESLESKNVQNMKLNQMISECLANTNQFGNIVPNQNFMPQEPPTNHQINTTSPSFKPRVQKQLSYEQQHEFDDQNLSIANQCSLDQLAFNLHNIQSFNPTNKNISNLSTSQTRKTNSNVSSFSNQFSMPKDANTSHLNGFNPTIGFNQQNQMFWMQPDQTIAQQQPFNPHFNEKQVKSFIKSPDNLKQELSQNSQTISQQKLVEKNKSCSPPISQCSQTVNISDQLNLQNQFFNSHMNFTNDEPQKQSFEGQNSFNMTSGSVKNKPNGENQMVFNNSGNQYSNIQNTNINRPQSEMFQQQVSQSNFMTPPSNGDQGGKVNQMNSFNINVFGNLNIGSLVQTNNSQLIDQPAKQPDQYGNQLSQDQINLSNQIKNLVGMPLMNMQVSQMNNNQQFLMQASAQQSMYSNYLYDQHIQQTIECQFYEKFDNDIYDEVNRIQVYLDQTKEERNYVLDKLQKMCESVFEEEKFNSQSVDQNNSKPRIMQFGSLMTGLALESSDMDMAVTNLFLPDREKMIVCLDQFAGHLQKWDIIKDLNAISTASIPVIKANIDLKLLRDKELSISPLKKKESPLNDFGDAQNELPNQSKRANSNDSQTQENLKPENLKIDITFDDNMSSFKNENMMFEQNSFYDNINQKTHQGLASSQLIKTYVEHYKCLKEVSIILKQFLARMDLNSPYHGGISSYSTVLLLVAYMNKWNLKTSPTLTPSRLLMGFLDYYSYYFNAQQFGIDVSNNGSFYQLGSPESNFVILDPLNHQNNTTRNSFLTHEIIKSFRKAFNLLKNMLGHYQKTKNTDIQDNLLDLILQRNQAQLIEQKIMHADDSQ